MHKLSNWGAVHAAARDAERQAERQDGAKAEHFRAEARSLREYADRLHAELVRPQGGDGPR